MMTIYEFVAWSLDFEGCVSVNRTTDNRSGRYIYSARVELYSSILEHLHHFQKRIGFGYVNPNPSPSDLGNASYVWRLRHDEIREHLPKIHEFLYLKQRQAELVLELLTMKLSRSTGKRTVQHDGYVLLQMESLYQESKSLNRRTVKQLTEAEAFYRELRRR